MYSREGEVREPMTEEQMRQSQARLGEIEREMATAGAWVFSGRLHEPDPGSAACRNPGARQRVSLQKRSYSLAGRVPTPSRGGMTYRLTCDYVALA